MTKVLLLTSSKFLLCAIIRVFAIFRNTSLLKEIEGTLYYFHKGKQAETRSHFLPMSCVAYYLIVSREIRLC